MFNLIIGVIATVVMIAVAVAGISYLGPSFTKATVSAHAAQFLNSAVQIEGAQSVQRAQEGGGFVADGATPGDAVAKLVSTGYLKSSPAVPPYASRGAAWNVVPAVDGRRPLIVIPVDEGNKEAMAVCNELSERLTGHAGCTDDLTKLAVPE